VDLQSLLGLLLTNSKTYLLFTLKKRRKEEKEAGWQEKREK